MLSERVSCQEMKIVFFKFNRLVVSDCIQARGCGQWEEKPGLLG